MPSKGTTESGGFDIYMPTDGIVSGVARKVGLGFASEIPSGHVALLLPRSGAGVNFGLELNNTCGVIDADYRGEWMAVLRTKDPEETFRWKAGDRVLQFILVPVARVTLELVESVARTERGAGGFGSTGVA